ncbi:MAG: Sec-independent protein translocase protein TatB [Acidimicrobiales bacterium]
MFNIGGGELLVIMLLALIVLGPQRLPDAARQVGKAMGELRRLSSGFQSELKQALDETAPTTPRRVSTMKPAATERTATEPTGTEPAETETPPPRRRRRTAPLQAERRHHP